MFEATHQGNSGVDLSGPEALGVRGGNVRDADLERVNGAGRIVLTGSASGTRISEVHQKFPIGLMFPRIGDDVVKEAVIINSSGRIAGCDRLAIEGGGLDNAAGGGTPQA